MSVTDLKTADLAETRARVRAQADKAELRAALHDLAEGLRGLVRVAPLTAVLSGVALGVMLNRRR